MNTPGLLPPDILKDPAPGNALYEQLLALEGIGDLRARYVAGLFMHSMYPGNVRAWVNGRAVEPPPPDPARSTWNLFLWQLIYNPDRLYELHKQKNAATVMIIIGDIAREGWQVPEKEDHLKGAGNTIQRFDRASIQSLRAWALEWAHPVQPDKGTMDRWLGGRKSKLPKVVKRSH